MKNEINILITSVSRKVWQVEAFKDALRHERIKGKVISADIDPLSAGFYMSDEHYLVPRRSDKDFIPEILRICKKEKVKLLIPTSDGELLLFAKNKNKFKRRGIEVMVSPLEVIKTCGDKYRFYQFLNAHGIQTPHTVLPDRADYAAIRYPVLVKPRRGSGGKGIFKAENKRELKFFLGHVFDPIIQQYIEGKEYTVDLFSDFNKSVLTVLPRERIEVLSGESYKAKTVKDEEMIACAKNVSEKLGSIGHITLQFIRSKDSLNLIEINPRFGGGAMLGIKAGHNTHLLLIKLIAGKRVRPQIGGFRENTVMLRYTKDIFLFNDKPVA